MSFCSAPSRKKESTSRGFGFFGGGSLRVNRKPCFEMFGTPRGGRSCMLSPVVLRGERGVC